MIRSDSVCVFAGHRLMTLIDLEPDNEKIYYILGLLSRDDKKFDQAKAWYDKAIEVLLGILVFITCVTEILTFFRWINRYFVYNLQFVRYFTRGVELIEMCVQLGIFALSLLALEGVLFKKILLLRKLRL